MIIVFGSLNIDMVMRLEKMPRPGETVLCPRYQLVAGGKGANQAVAAAKSGVSVKLFGTVGDDELGRTVLDALKESPVDIMGVLVNKALPTGCATVCVDAEGENMIIVASGANLNASESEIPSFLLAEGTTLLLQMETPPEENWKLIQRAKKSGAKIILNFAPAQDIPRNVLESLDYLVMNQNEANLLALYLGFEVISPTVTAKRTAAHFGMTCIVTLGKIGAVACTSEGTWEVKAMEIEAVDTTAAGDAFVGVLAASLDSGMDLPNALRRASVASGLACLNRGAQSSLPTSQEIDKELTKVPLPRKIA
ncbi:MAG TPA: ribokinase [Alphaproteobacteria bacterium]|nr:ribokinase [Alphaproteobacteria bacterium]